MFEIRRKISKIPWERVANTDGSFNKDCLSFEEFRTEWVKGTNYENETEWAQRRLYDNTLKRLHVHYSGLKKEREQQISKSN